jgi:hypothetical protein
VAWDEDAVPPLPSPGPDQSEGEDHAADFEAITSPVRYDNATSILTKPFIVSGSLAAVDVAGRAGEIAWQLESQAMVMKARVEGALLANVAKSYVEPQHMAGLQAWADQGDGTALNAQVAANTVAGMETAASNMGTYGHYATVWMGTPAAKNLFSKSSATPTSAKEMEHPLPFTKEPLEGAVSLYLSDYGCVQMVVNRWFASAAGDRSYLLNHREHRIATVAGRDYAVQDLGKTGDALKKLMVWEGTLEANPNAIATLA